MPYRAQGTIRCEIELTSGRVTKLFFTPSSDYSITHNDKKYGVFVCRGNPSTKAIMRCYDYTEIRLRIDNTDNLFAAGLVSAIVSKCKVEVVVEEKEELHVTNIVIPTP